MTETLFSNSELLAADGLGPWPLLVRPEEAVNVKRACELSGKTDRTIRDWCRQFGIGGAMAGSQLRISAPGLMMVVHGDVAALEFLRQGNRSHPRVLRYFDELGIRV
ncbi:hypothetical protein B5K03_08815 [Rhizobium phaseoli]|uniref:hypothetical protein n=1 Tax=Rhizobium phaseoli TaxID=396 RepID=UPI000D67ACB5|nr:hypothetical protein [Rhizobium phaseoli]PWI54811.1 hypothetical protein B5K03_08815 [Rhizobium phaseoli]